MVTVELDDKSALAMQYFILSAFNSGEVRESSAFGQVLHSILTQIEGELDEWSQQG